MPAGVKSRWDPKLENLVGVLCCFADLAKEMTARMTRRRAHSCLRSMPSRFRCEHVMGEETAHDKCHGKATGDVRSVDDTKLQLEVYAIDIQL